MCEIWGVMQGRLTDKGGFFPQQFPWESWEKEFSAARDLRIDCIEWMFNLENYESNPFITKTGVGAIKRVTENTGVAVRSVCANYYIQYPVAGVNSGDIFKRLYCAAEQLQLHHIVFPLFEASEVTDQGRLPEVFWQIEHWMSNGPVKVYFECDHPLECQTAALDSVGSPMLGLCYDLGNSTGCGYNCVDGVKRLVEGKYNFELHIKDKKIHGGTVMLGDGDVDFAAALNAAQGVGGLRVYESYYGKSAVEDTAKNIAYIRGILGR